MTQNEEGEGQIIEKSFGSKAAQQKFDQNIVELLQRINVINDKVKRLNKTLNHRNNRIVQDVSNIIHKVLHETNELSTELNATRAKASMEAPLMKFH